MAMKKQNEKSEVDSEEPRKERQEIMSIQRPIARRPRAIQEDDY